MQERELSLLLSILFSIYYFIRNPKRPVLSAEDAACISFLPFLFRREILFCPFTIRLHFQGRRVSAEKLFGSGTDFPDGRCFCFMRFRSKLRDTTLSFYFSRIIPGNTAQERGIPPSLRLAVLDTTQGPTHPAAIFIDLDIIAAVPHECAQGTDDIGTP